MESPLQRLRDYLTWLITPQTEQEKEIYAKNPDMMDERIDIMSRIDSMTEQELVTEINAQLTPFGISVELTLN